MRDDKTKLTPIELPKSDAQNAAEKQARDEIARARQATAQFKKNYFDFYDDVKIGHREDW